ncbi:STAS domain-containing protein [Peribacillus sp. SCS-155]|uniref:STAS domain-containing protein n=1 Tax=Peribacillus sedimenti TaxID=3115297 RepID=UPI003905AB4C
MGQLEEDLYSYIINQSNEISDIWFSTRKVEIGSIYSSDAGESVTDTLKQQHIYTIDTIASGFLEDKTIFKDKFDTWIEEVVNSRVEYETPIYQVVEALGKTKRIIWEFVQEYIRKNEEINRETILRWSSLYNSILDTLITEFSRRYYEATRAKIKVQKDLIEEINSPVIPVVDGVAVLPLVGHIDEMRAHSILESIPQKCVDMRIVHLVIDMSGANYIDTVVGERLYQLVKVINLLGINTLISGIGAEMAQTAIQLGVDLSHLQTFGNLGQALEHFGVSKKEE